MVAKSEFIEYAHVYGNWYGTPRKALMDKMEQGIDVLLEIDVQGALQIKKNVQDAVYIFILPPSMEILRTRLQGRASDTPEEIMRRLQKVKEEVWSCSWRYAGGILADIMGEGDYMDWYCGGLEGTVDEEVEQDLYNLGWLVVNGEK